MFYVHIPQNKSVKSIFCYYTRWSWAEEWRLELDIKPKVDQNLPGGSVLQCLLAELSYSGWFQGLVFFLQESHALGKKPENPEDMIKEGELILSVNILYPVIFNKVSSETWFSWLSNFE